MSLAGSKLGPYEILAFIGAGGMGEVYRARDTRLHRTVAIKLVRHELAGRSDFRERFQREARAISALNHPHICALHDIGEQDGLDYLVMEFVEGKNLADVLKKGRLPVESAIRYGAEVAGALAAAHAHGVIHRDLKPGNIMITEAGVKVLDFGLAKRSEAVAASGDGATVTLEAESSAGQLLGTVAYMSPEQAEGRPVDARSDIFVLGVVMYEMLSGRRPFRGESTLSTLASILKENPESPRQARPEIPVELERIVLRSMAKKPEERYASAADVARDLEQLRKPAATGVTLRRPLVAALALVLLVVLGALGTRWYLRSSKARWAETVALPQAAQLMERSQPLAALRLVQQASPYAASSPELVRLKEDLRVLPTTIETTPAAAEIYATDYADPKAADLSQWEHLGRSPLKTDRLPRRGYYRVRAEKDGFEPVESAIFNDTYVGPLQMQLHTKEETPAGMVWIPAGPPAARTLSRLQLPAVPIPAAWMDKYEVTNRQFKEFVDAGGYQKRDYWKQPFVKDGKRLAWEEAMAGFRDATGRPGPSTWEAGSYPDGKADFPVGGVSWFEAAAYAEFAGKNLPTVSHWYIAAGIGANSQIISLSNFSGQGPARVGSNLGMTPYGIYDMAGNVKEWTTNLSGAKRYILGGGWNESSYQYQQPDARSPWGRDATFGFRCARYISPVPETLNGPMAINSGDRSHDQPVDDRTFQVFKSLLSYDKSDLKATLDSVTDAPHWRRENVSFQAAYGSERVILHLYLPKDATPPYQPVFYFGGANMLLVRTPEEVSTRLMEYIVRSGRAVILPAYAGTLERESASAIRGPGGQRDLAVQQFKDAARTIDYLETRRDIDTSKLGFSGVSYGSVEGLIILGAEPRFKAAVLVSIGSTQARSAEVDTWNYAPRVKIPVLMLNGHDDSLFPLETSQNPLFKALRSPEKDKRHLIYPGGHIDFMDRLEVIKEALDWLDRYLGPVKTQP